MHNITFRLINLLGLFFFAVLITDNAFAGPLRDRIQAKIEGHQSEQSLPSMTAHAKTDAKKTTLSYGTDPLQSMDIYLPDHPQNAPVIFMVHGGGWRHGDMDSGRVVDNKVAHWLPKGFIFISVNYRMLPEAQVSVQADDVTAALAKAQQTAPTWGGDPSRFILMGHSAGGHLVSLIGADPSRAYKVGAKQWLGTISLDSAALNVSDKMNMKHFKLFDDAFGTDPAVWKDLSPSDRLTAQAPPYLLVYSSKREDSLNQAKNFATKAKGLGVQATLHGEDLSHGEINSTLGLPGAYTQSVDDFIASLIK